MAQICKRVTAGGLETNAESFHSFKSADTLECQSETQSDASWQLEEDVEDEMIRTKNKRTRSVVVINRTTPLIGVPIWVNIDKKVLPLINKEESKEEANDATKIPNR